MIERINFIEKKTIQVTYGLCLALLGTSLLICLFFYGGLLLMGHRSQTEATRLKAEIHAFKQERERLLSHEKEVQGIVSHAEIQKLLKASVSWSFILNTIAETLPPNVWLTSLKSSNQENNAEKTLILNGQAKNPQSLTAFLAGLEASPHFENVNLTSSKEEMGKTFQFSAACVINKGNFK